MRGRTLKKYNSESKSKSQRFKIKIRWSRLFIYLSLLLILSYGIFAYISFSKINTKDPLKDQGGRYFLLSNLDDDFEKTLLVFENTSDEKNRIEKVYIHAQNAQKKQSVLIYVPSWIYFGGLENDFGNAVPLSSFKYAGEFLQSGKGIEYSVWQIEQMLGIKVDEYIWFTPESLRAIEENLGDIEGDTVYSQYYQNSRDISENALFLNSFISHLNWFKLVVSANKFKDSSTIIYSSHSSVMSVFVNLKQLQSSVFEYKPYLLDLSLGEMLVQKESPSSGGLINHLNSSEFDSKWRDLTEKMTDKKLEQERVRVEVYNASGIAGAASQFARKIENAGCEVVRYDNAPDLEEVTKFYVPNPQYYPQSLSTIEELFPGKYEQLTSRPLFMTTGDIVILLGKDISQMYSF